MATKSIFYNVKITRASSYYKDHSISGIIFLLWIFVMNFSSLCAALAKYLSCSYHPNYKFKLIFFSNRGIISHWKDYYSKNSEIIEARMFEWFNFLLYFTNSSWNLCCISNSFICGIFYLPFSWKDAFNVHISMVIVFIPRLTDYFDSIQFYSTRM